MHSSTTHIHEKDIVEIAKNVMKVPGWKCEWGSTLTSASDCKVVLISWNAYLQHLLIHCKHGKTNDKKKYPCHLPRCNVPQDIAFFDSYGDLIKHVESSHMNRVPLVCPLSDCHAPVFSRPGALEAHVTEMHQEIIGLPLTTPLILPSWIPSPWTTQQMLPSPNLPSNVCPAEILAGACSGNWKTTKEIQQPQVVPSQPRFLSPKKYQTEPPLSNQGGKSLETLIFTDLLRESDKHGMWIDDLHAKCLIQGRGIHVDLSRPQSMFPPEACVHKIPQKTIHYKVFEQRLKKLEREEGKDESLV